MCKKRISGKQPLSSNNIDVCFVSETWLNSNISSNLVCSNGYNILRNDRLDFRKGGGVAILYKTLRIPTIPNVNY